MKVPRVKHEDKSLVKQILMYKPRGKLNISKPNLRLIEQWVATDREV